MDEATRREVHPLEVLYERPGLPAFPLPEALAAVYGGTLGFPEERVFANFVSTIDGVVSLTAMPRSVSVLGGGTETDRFVMALLRACADAIVMGATTVANSSEGRWTAQGFYPPAAEAHTELRGRLGLRPEPELAIVTGSGRLDLSHPALEAGALVLTTTHGAAVLEGRLPEASTAVPLGEERVELDAALKLLRSRGHRRILTEGGPHMLGSLLEAGLVDELFLTVSPLLAGRNGAGGRLALVQGAELLPDRPHPWELASVRRDRDYLFLRYART
jgi:riboflavin biosynthesis pyrimidine reductase